MSDRKRPGSYRGDDSEGTVAPKSRRSQDEGSDIDKQEQSTQKIKNPGKKEYQELGRLLHILQQLTNKKELTAEDNDRVYKLLSDLLDLLRKQPEDEDEEEEDEEVVKIANYIKLLQIHLKDKHIKSQGINDEYNTVNFLEGLEDGSASVSDQDKVFVFLAPQATELWYRWNEKESQWEWTPDKVNWMLCSRTTVSGGKWKDETPAPENVEIICYLNSVRPVPSDEQYLQRFDVFAILRQLKENRRADIKSLIDKIVVELNNKNGFWIDEEFSL